VAAEVEVVLVQAAVAKLVTLAGAQVVALTYIVMPGQV
jgi:hypothetical protein